MAIDVTYIESWVNILGITKAIAGLQVTGQPSSDRCTFAAAPVATAQNSAGTGVTITILGQIQSRNYKTPPVPPPPAVNCDAVDCYVFTMNYQVDIGLWSPWGTVPLRSFTDVVEVWVTSDGRSGKSQ